MTATKRTFLQNKNLKGYLFFLLLTAVMAVLTKLSKEYTTASKVDIQIGNIPENLSLFNSENNIIEITHELNGFALLRNTLRKKELLLDFTELEKISEKEYRLELSSQFRPLASLLSSNTASMSAKPKELIFTMNEQEVKEVPVVVPMDISYISGYGAFGNPQIIPSVVNVIGPKSIIDTIRAVNTNRLTLKDVNSDIVSTLTIDFKGDDLKIDISPETIKVKQKVTKFTEGTIDVPIRVIYDEAGKIQIFPKSVRIQYAVALDHFDQVKTSDFEVSCDFDSGVKSSQYLQLKIIKQPSYVSKVRLMTKQVQYVIVNK